MEINRVDLLHHLELVSFGLSKRAIVEQSGCFVFSGGLIRTFNDELSCSIPTNLPISGAVPAEALLAILNKISQEQIKIEQRQGELLLRTTKSRTGIVMESEITLPVDSVELPEKWKPLPEQFCHAVDLAKSCASKDNTRFDLCCVHLHPDWVEACDGVQMLRYPVKTGFKTSQLIRAECAKHLAPLGVTHLSADAVWLHFKNEGTGLTCSIRRYEEKYPDLTGYYDIGGEPLTFPSGLREMVEKANVFSASGNDLNQVQVRIKDSKISVKGFGSFGWHQEVGAVKFASDKELAFMIPPKLLMEFSDQLSDCLITSTRLLVDGGAYKWLGCLEEAKVEESAK